MRRVVSRRFAIPLQLSQAETYGAWRVALVGDAAHSVHPMAGQGLNLGLGDVEALAAALGRNARAGMDLGDPTKAIGEYDRERRQVRERRKKMKKERGGERKRVRERRERSHAVVQCFS